MAKSINHYLLKLTRLTGWLLFPLILLYIVTGFALCGKLGFTAMIGTRTALAVHKIFDEPLVVLFLVHSLAGMYLALRRWGWLGRRTRT